MAIPVAVSGQRVNIPDIRLISLDLLTYTYLGKLLSSCTALLHVPFTVFALQTTRCNRFLRLLQLKIKQSDNSTQFITHT